MDIRTYPKPIQSQLKEDETAFMSQVGDPNDRFIFKKKNKNKQTKNYPIIQ